ncbi:MAG: 5-dehydro-4-deoxy-D-glucuronate isomerase [Deltaproteobacteria bacterium]|nr:5-dehydro-4-deoxy-D-glucuronate isomerase [Deltaproteobacteria bacterium]
MDIRNAMHPDHLKMLGTEGMRKQLLVESLFENDKLKMVYSHVDRIIVGGACPVNQKVTPQVTKQLGVDFFLQRREMGIINVGGKGTVTADGKEHVLDRKDCLYVGMGIRELSFTGADKKDPAKFYFASAPAHAAYPTVRVSRAGAQQVNLGAAETSNQRTIYQMVHPSVLKSCQLVMGLTELAPGCVWNTMPCHTHDRRMEVYFYLDVPQEAVVFHLFGEPGETRHIVVRNEQAVISPSWSIHSGVGTASYSFIWAMVGENQTFTDMDHVAMADLK